MRLTWYGHACFRLEADGLSLVTDPYTPANAGLDPVPEPADVVVMSSSLDEAHSCPEQVPGSPRVLNALEAVGSPVEVAPGVVVEAVPASEGEDRPDDPKANALYRFELDGIAFCHMGDVGTPLAEAQLAPLRGRVDVLLALAGAGLTIALPDLDEAIAAIGPKVVVPMHHRTPSLRYAVGPVEDFLARRGGDRIVRHDGSTLELDAGSLPDSLEIHVLQAACDPQLNGGSQMAWELGLIDSVWQGSEHDGLPGHTLAREIGYDSLDLFVGFDPGSEPAKRQQVIDDARAAHLPVRSLIATCLGLNDFNTAVREFAIRRACNVVDMAAEFDTARNLLFVPGEYMFQRRLLPPEQEWARVVDATRRVGGHAAGRGLEVAIELLPFEHAFIRTLDDLDRLLAEVGLPNVKAAIDISHLWLERIEPSRLADFAGRIAHVHIADCDGENHGDLPPGRGTTPFPAYLEALRAAGFEGTAAVELEFPVDGAPLRDWVTEAYGTSSRLLADAGVRG